jgi:hypothetical protein
MTDIFIISLTIRKRTKNLDPPLWNRLLWHLFLVSVRYQWDETFYFRSRNVYLDLFYFWIRAQLFANFFRLPYIQGIVKMKRSLWLFEQYRVCYFMALKMDNILKIIVTKYGTDCHKACWIYVTMRNKILYIGFLFYFGCSVEKKNRTWYIVFGMFNFQTACKQKEKLY